MRIGDLAELFIHVCATDDDNPLIKHSNLEYLILQKENVKSECFLNPDCDVLANTDLCVSFLKNITSVSVIPKCTKVRQQGEGGAYGRDVIQLINYAKNSQSRASSTIYVMLTGSNLHRTNVVVIKVTANAHIISDSASIFFQVLS